ncbi:hypothetical protein EA58_14855 [Photobacterium galatheae]|uniref:Uncharacterized protein n=2 Tax=Photobacterium galatheae TaxID=1654360 RepID=A0A066RPI2_9GAMM|nr:hypothetical protein EA58_14855 [Photobacterium galatheae]
MMYWGLMTSVFTLGLSAIASSVIAKITIRHTSGIIHEHRKGHLENIAKRGFIGGFPLFMIGCLGLNTALAGLVYFPLGIYFTLGAIRGYIRYTDGLDSIQNHQSLRRLV